MHLITNINVKVPVTAGSNKTGLLKATFNNNPIGIETKETRGFTAPIKYTVIVDEGGEDVEYDVLMKEKGRIPVTGVEFQTVYNIVKGGLPSEDDMEERLLVLGFEIVKARMIAEFDELTVDGNFVLNI